jgi:predicted SnoaL-like aldol condensation-catalyzing enzyme
LISSGDRQKYVFVVTNGETSALVPSPVDRRAFFADFAELMYARRDVRTAFDRYVAVDYVQHNPGLADGRDAARDALAGKFAEPDFSVEVVRMLVDGDLCALHIRASRDGEPAAALVDLYRADGDRIVEHWDVIQPWPATAANDHPMF